MSIINPLAGTSFDALGYMVAIIPYLLRGAWTSLKLAGVGLVGGLVLAIPLSLMKTYGKGPIRWISSIYIEFFRGTPLLLQLYIIYFGLPDVGIVFERTVAVWVTLSLNSAAYQAEYFRGALNTIDPGQITAARAMGMSFFKIARYVILPQLVRIALPAWSNEAVYIVKYAAVAFTIAVEDLMSLGKSLVAAHFRPIEVYIVVALMYIAMLSVLAAIMNWVERKISIPGLLLDSDRDSAAREIA